MAAGLRHMINTVTGSYEFPIVATTPFDLDSCLDCHAGASRFREVRAHRTPEIQRGLIAREIGCTGACHSTAHPAEALNGGAVQ